MKGIADTGFVVAFVSADDRHHRWAAGVAETFDAPFLTCEAVLAEAAFHLGGCRPVIALLEDGFLEVAFDVRAHLPRLSWLAARYADRSPDLADLCLIRMSELHPRRTVVTVDRRDFTVYRRNKRDVIPLALPPQA